MKKSIVVYYSGQAFGVDTEVNKTGGAVITSVLLALRTKDDVKNYELRDIGPSAIIAPEDLIDWKEAKPFLMTKLPPAPAAG